MAELFYIAQLQKQYKSYLQRLVAGDPFEPILLRGGKSRPENTVDLHKAVALFQTKEKKEGQSGWTIKWEDWSSKKLGLQKWPARITVDTEEDFLLLLSKKSHADTFKSQLFDLLSWQPALKTLFHNSPDLVTDHLDNWPEIKGVIDYLLNNDVTGQYIRSIPVPTHTKFLQANSSVLYSILKCLKPDLFTDASSDLFTALDLMKKPVLFTMRILDETIANKYMSGVAHIAIPIESLRQLKWPISKVILVENETNLYLLPPAKNTLAIFSSGKALHLLSNIGLLTDAELLYWGDLDDEGFAMLNDIRKYYPQARSILMDKKTVEKHAAELIRQPAKYRTRDLQNLTIEEQETYTHLAECNGRIEQERLRQDYVIKCLSDLLPVMIHNKHS